MSWNTTEVRQLRSALVLHDDEHALIIGCILGDGSLAPTATGRNYRLQIVQCAEQEIYLRWKYAYLQRWTLSEPAFQRTTNSWRFRTVSHPSLTRMAERFYVNGKKRVPLNIATDLRNPLTMATWFMDDGCRYPQGSLVLNTQCFDLEDQIILQTALRNCYGISTTLQRNHGRLRIYIPVASAKLLIEHIAPHILPTFDYKIGRPRRDFNPMQHRIVMAGTL